ncbi:DUF3987 domain-containing protein [Halieaceae bacterium IMCC8485]|uniref:DUF3987 domain-containing protein n=1 Tax=Candidatus Seongchinamella marina TaxID=2518990 RepID=A0ABT3SSN8_9GAMM|nr:DUF3987 domain-containing protein [Candidatus Seongchinamella marina]MCX2972993.1 DUF3987 domain-containing protein [Candidatus Seongchinamella marina]
MMLHIATGRYKSDTSIKTAEVSLEDMQAMLSRFEYRQNKDGPYYIPAKFKKKYREHTNIINWDGAVIDLDEDANASEDIIRERLEGIAYMAHTTHRHLIKVDGVEMWRVFIPFSQPVTPAVYKKVAAKLNALFPGTDRGTEKSMQFYFQPSCPPDMKDAARAFDTLDGGEILNPVKFLDEPLQAVPDAPAPVKRVQGGVSEGSRNDNLTRNVASWLNDGLSLDELLGKAKALNLENNPPLPDAEVVQTVKSMIGTHLNNPENDFPAVHDTDAHQWPELVDPFAQMAAPPFPLDTLPGAMRDYCVDKARQSGFDVGGYAFCALVAAGCTADHRIKMDCGAFKVPAFMWGGLVDPSGGGKTPLMNAAKEPAEDIDQARQDASSAAHHVWKSACRGVKQEDRPAKPAWFQRHATDITTEALGELLVDNPEGVNLFHDELTEFLGRMDAYSGKSGKDQAVFLKGYDGSAVTINRVGNKGEPHRVPNFSVGILAGVQPEVLGEKFKSRSQGAVGLYQRFMVYAMREAGEVNYADTDESISKAYADLFAGLDAIRFNTIKAVMGGSAINLSNDGRELMSGLHNHYRTIAKRTPGGRFQEHLNKFPGFLGRITLTLHLMDSVTNNTDHMVMVSAETVERASRILACLYKHSEAVYAVLDREASDTHSLVVTACEAILAKGWKVFTRSDLTANATHWRKGDDYGRQGEGAIDLLIEFGWIRDITNQRKPGQRGRRSAGKFEVNPLVSAQFLEHAQRVMAMREERFAAIQIAVEARRKEKEGNS